MKNFIQKTESPLAYIRRMQKARKVLGFKKDEQPSAKEVRARYLALVKSSHPDTCDSTASTSSHSMDKLRKAKDALLEGEDV